MPLSATALQNAATAPTRHVAALLFVLFLLLPPDAERPHAVKQSFGIRLVIRTPIRSAMVGGAAIAAVSPESHYDAALGLSQSPSRIWSSHPGDEIDCVARNPLQGMRRAAATAMPAWTNVPSLGNSRVACFLALVRQPQGAAQAGDEAGGTRMTLLFE